MSDLVPIANEIAKAIASRDPSDVTVAESFIPTLAARITALETAQAEARNAALEEAAKVAGTFRSPRGVPSIDYDQACDDIAQAIRDMKDRT